MSSSVYNKVIWSEGMSLSPQHFQQQTRYFERLIETRCQGLLPYSWGIKKIQIDRQQLVQGKFALSLCHVILPDGSVAHLPDDGELPPPLDLTGDFEQTLNQQIIYLTLPLQRAREQGIESVDSIDDTQHLARYITTHYPAENTHASSNAKHQPMPAQSIPVGKTCLRFMLEHENRGEQSGIGIAQIKEIRGSEVVLNDEGNGFISSVMDCQASSALIAYINELLTLCRARIDEVSTNATEPLDFLRLQTLNRYALLLNHFYKLNALHPELLYRELLKMAGDLSIFQSDKRPASLSDSGYKHENLYSSFHPVMEELRRLLDIEVDLSVIRIPLIYQEGVDVKLSIYKAPIGGKVDLSALLDTCHFLLAVDFRPMSSDLSGEKLLDENDIHAKFLKQLKVGPIEQIDQIVRMLLSGVKVRLSPMGAVKQIYRQGLTYFELVPQGHYWEKIKQSQALAIHIEKQFKNIEIALWAIKK